MVLGLWSKSYYSEKARIWSYLQTLAKIVRKIHSLIPEMGIAETSATLKNAKCGSLYKISIEFTSLAPEKTR